MGEVSAAASGAASGAESSPVASDDAAVEVPNDAEGNGKQQKVRGPRRPENSFLLFANEFRKKIRKQHPGMKNGELSRVLGVAWRSLDPADKAKYEEQAKAIRDKFRLEHPEYNFFGMKERAKAAPQGKANATAPLSEEQKASYKKMWQATQKKSRKRGGVVPGAIPVTFPYPSAPPSLLSPSSALPGVASITGLHSPAHFPAPPVGPLYRPSPGSSSAYPSSPPSPPRSMFGPPSSFGSFGVAARRAPATSFPAGLPLSALTGECCPPGSVCGPGQVCVPGQAGGPQEGYPSSVEAPAVRLSVAGPAPPTALPCCSELGNRLPPLSAGAREPQGAASWETWRRYSQGALPPLADLFPEFARPRVSLAAGAGAGALMDLASSR
eukprot:tig00000615_g2575.t1